MKQSQRYPSENGESEFNVLSEIAAILAKGVARLHIRQKQAGSTPETSLENLRKTLSSCLPSAEQTVLSVVSPVNATGESHYTGELR